ncbi:MAG: aryl-sulfate sulfotransferase [Acidimicrobiia bacterium]
MANARSRAVGLLVGALALAGGWGEGDDDSRRGAARGLPRGLVTNEPGAFEGYTLYSPLTQDATYLVDLDGEVVHKWAHDTQPGLYQYLQENGNLLRTGRIERETRFNAGNGFGGVIEEVDWEGQPVWRFEYASDEHMQHHDVERLPNGNVLILAWEYRSDEEAIAAGRDPELIPDGEVWPDTVVEYDPRSGQIVWEWRVWDHLIQDHDPTNANYGNVAAHPEKIDINLTDQSLQNPGEADWNHATSVAYNPQLDQIVISLRSFNEIWIIDHATSTEEARGPAGDLLFRYGNPATYRADGVADQKLFAQHDAEWIADGLKGAGNILVFNNGLPRIRPYSSVDEVVPVMDGHRYVQNNHGVFAAEIRRVYPQRQEDRFFAAILSGSQRLPNGNTIVVYGTHGRILEVTPVGRVVWEYENPYFTVRPQTPMDNPEFEIEPWRTFRAERYASSYPAFAGRDLDN